MSDVVEIEAEVARVMGSVWALVRSAPNFDGRDRAVERAIAAAIKRAEAAECERCAQLCELWNVTPGGRLAAEIRKWAERGA